MAYKSKNTKHEYAKYLRADFEWSHINTITVGTIENGKLTTKTLVKKKGIKL